MRQTLCQEYLWNRAIVLSSAVSWSLWPSSRSAASLSRASVVSFLSASAVMLSSFGRVVRGSFAARGTRQPVLEDTRLGHRHVEHRGVSHRACQRTVLARREAAGER